MMVIMMVLPMLSINASTETYTSDWYDPDLSILDLVENDGQPESDPSVTGESDGTGTDSGLNDENEAAWGG